MSTIILWVNHTNGSFASGSRPGTRDGWNLFYQHQQVVHAAGGNGGHWCPLSFPAGTHFNYILVFNVKRIGCRFVVWLIISARKGNDALSAAGAALEQLKIICAVEGALRSIRLCACVTTFFHMCRGGSWTVTVPSVRCAVLMTVLIAFLMIHYCFLIATSRGGEWRSTKCTFLHHFRLGGRGTYWHEDPIPTVGLIFLVRENGNCYQRHTTRLHNKTCGSKLTFARSEIEPKANYLAVRK